MYKNDKMFLLLILIFILRYYKNTYSLIETDWQTSGLPNNTQYIIVRIKYVYMYFIIFNVES